MQIFFGFEKYIYYKYMSKKIGIQFFMPKTYLNGTRLIKRKKAIWLKIGIILISIVVLASLFFSGFGIAKLLTGVDFNLFASGKIKIDGINYYAITFGEFDDEQLTTNCAIWTANSGGASYIYERDKSVVIGQIYNNVDDANSVVNGFSDDITYKANIMQFKSKKLTFSIDNVTHSDKKCIVGDIKSVLNKIDEILEISNNLDEGKYTTVTASSKINSIKSEIKVLKSELQLINSTYNNKDLNSFLGYVIKVEDSLDICVNKLLTSENVSNVCKYCACEVFFNYYDFVENFVK